jgi:P4 family phage/plasmid primase-like protien
MNWAESFDLTEKECKDSRGLYCPTVAADAILDKTTNGFFITPMNDQGGDVIWWYNTETGIFTQNGVPIIEQIVRDVLGEKARVADIRNTVKMVKIATYTDPQLFEPSIEYIVLLNGTLDLETMTLGRHSYLYNQKARIPVIYDAEKDCPEIKQFLDEICPDEVETLQEWFGYHLLKDYRYQKAFIFTGKGANGKSTLFDLVTRWIGPENISNQSLYDLTANRFSVAELYGKLANISPDVGADELKRTGTFKALTGGDWIKAERKNRDPFSYKNYAKLNFACNQLPTSPDNSDAFFRRFMVFEFNNVFNEENADPNILEKLTTPDELSGLLNWSLEGLQRLMQRGHFKVTKTTEQMRRYYQELASPELAFYNNCIEDNGDGLVTKEQLYFAYSSFCQLKGFVAQAKNKYVTALNQHVILSSTQPTIDGKRITAWKGIDLLCGSTSLCNGCKGCNGISFSVHKEQNIGDMKIPLQPSLPLQQDGLIRTSLQGKLRDLFAIIFDKNPDTISEYELVDEHGYDHDELKKLLQVLARDNMIYCMKPGVWGVVG